MGRVLAAYEFDADGTEFRLRSPHGDWIVLDVQISDASSGSSFLYFINVGFTIGARWDWVRSALTNRQAGPSVPDCLWRERIDPPRGDRSKRWVIDSEAALRIVVDEMTQVLHQEVPGLLQLLDRRQLRDLNDQDVRMGYAAWQVRAWLLAEDGRTGELEALLQSLVDDDEDEDEDEDEEHPLFHAMRELASQRAGETDDPRAGSVSIR
ncbi:DUF4304 domain-containing protein [Micromonospora sp. NPDC005299]|uniref:DUF4304 domain-containing protein n=1 Tax=Micromonospora sp. NPDC005299 TaxID=3364231 RepID=UPI0036BE0C51